jgi:hypothetical protein
MSWRELEDSAFILGHSHESDLSNLLNGGWPMIDPF